MAEEITRENVHLYLGKLLFWRLEKYAKNVPKFKNLADIDKDPNEYVFLRSIDHLNVQILTVSNFLKKDYETVMLPKLALDELETPKIIPLFKHLEDLEEQIISADKADKYDKLGRIKLIRILAQ